MADESREACGPNAVLKSEQWCHCHQGFRARNRPLKQCRPFTAGYIENFTGVNQVGGTFLAEFSRDCRCVADADGAGFTGGARRISIDDSVSAAAARAAKSPSSPSSSLPSPLSSLSSSSPLLPSVHPDAPPRDWRTQPWVEPGKSATITLFSSHFAEAEGAARRPHYAEIEGAMRANLRNPALTELYVLYDERPNDGCAELTSRLVKGGNANATPATDTALTCVESGSNRQQTVFELLHFASTHARRGSVGASPPGDRAGPAFAGDIVVLANPDVVFDKTLAAPADLLPELTERDVLVLSVTHGPDRELYDETVLGGHALAAGVPWPSTRTWCPSIRSDVSFTLSWDAFMFVPPLPPLNKTNLGHFMNELEAEHRTAWGLRDTGLTVRNACLFVKAQHFHLGPKMHRKRSDVPGERKLPKVGYHDNCGHGFPNELKMHPCVFYRPDWKGAGVYSVPTDACEFCPEESKCYP